MDDRSSELVKPVAAPATRSVLDVSSPKNRPRPDRGGPRGPEAHAAPASKAVPCRTGRKPTPRREAGPLARLSGRTLKLLATGLIFAAAAVAAVLIWDHYVSAPWTRDGRVRVQVANVTPQVSGQITELRIVDDQFVRRGDVLYVIDPFDFKVALQTARAQVRQRAADLQVKRVQAERRQHLSDLATTPEEQQQYVGNATQAEAAFEAAQAQEAQADVNLKRTAVTSPVEGFVTNLQMRVGDFAREGATNVSVIDSDSFWVDGYFEETKMARVCVGDAAQARLMGYAEPILGRVQSVARGISVSDAASSTQGLPNVDAVYTWVRLAQRVPVRVKIEHVPPGVPLVSGMTATVSVLDPATSASPWWRRKFDAALDGLRATVGRSTPRPHCVPAVGNLEGRTMTLPTPEPAPARPAGLIDPGLAPGMAVSPRPR